MSQTTEQIIESWINMTTVINNDRITTDMPYNESVICRLLYQYGEADVTATMLCDQTKMQKSQMNRTLSAMESRGLIKRERSNIDRREVFIRLNEPSITAYRQQHERIVRIVDQVLNDLGQDHADDIIMLFNKIVDVAKKTDWK